MATGRAYDTLDSLELPGSATLHDVYTLVLGLPMAQPGVCGILTTGALTLGQAQAPGGGWGRCVRFKSHREAWAVRSAPAGRIGQPLAVGEVRQVAVLLRASERGARGKVCTIKLWRPSDAATPPAKDDPQRARGCVTHGVTGVAIHGLNLFGTRATRDSPFFSTHGSHSVLSAVAVIHTEPAGAVCRVDAAMNPLYILAGAVAGFTVPDSVTARHCEEQYTESSWQLGVEKNQYAFARLIEAVGYPAGADTKLLFTASDIFEQASFCGYLDMLGDSFYDGALPDAAHQPTGIPLMLAIAVRIACDPARWGLNAARAGDAYATKEVAFMVESIMPSLLASSNDGVSSVQTFSVDVVINRALDAMRSNIRKLRSGILDGARGGVDHRRVDNTVKETMNFLYCLGVAVSRDVCGLRPECSVGAYTSSGLAHSLTDPVLESRTQSAYAAKLGQPAPRWRTLRTSTTGKRQLALAELLVSVDVWLRTSTYAGAKLSQTAQAPHSVTPHDLDPANAPAPPRSTAPTVAARRSAKKKSKRAIEEILADRCRLRDAAGSQCAQRAVASLFCDQNDPRLAECSAKLSGEAINQASGSFADVLQFGACVGIGELFEIASYVVTPSSAVQCAHCENYVNVVASIAFSGDLGKCKACGHPRCLSCVTNDIESGEEHRVLENCLFCT